MTPSSASTRHLRFGWWSLFAFLLLGVGLESLHGLKVGWYLDVGYEMRRLMFTLAHAHGTLFALVNLAAGLTLRSVPQVVFSRPASLALLHGSWILPLGFLLGGFHVHGGDPGIGIVLVPLGAVLVVFGVGSLARACSRALALSSS